jgi:hypothetical protein
MTALASVLSFGSGEPQEQVLDVVEAIAVDS